MVMLIGFLLLTMSFLDIVAIESPFPMASTKELQDKLKEKPLQLTVTLRENEVEVWSPFDKIAPKHIPSIAPGQPDLKTFHDFLVDTKRKFPLESKVVVVPYAGATYDILISVMDVTRMMDAGDPPIFVKNWVTGNDDSIKTLFPEVIFGNLLGDG